MFGIQQTSHQNKRESAVRSIHSARKENTSERENQYNKEIQSSIDAARRNNSHYNYVRISTAFLPNKLGWKILSITFS